MTYTPPLAGRKARAALLAEMVGEWESYPPVWTSTGSAPSIGNGTLTGVSVIIGDLCHFSIKVLGGSTTNWGTGSYAFTLPVQAAATADMVGTCFVGDASVGAAGYSTGIAFIGAGGTTVGGYIGPKNGASALSNTNPQTLATGDRLWLQGIFEVA
jgi:hypothetical protein